MQATHPTPPLPPTGARIGFGEVRHERRAPVHHAFSYPTCFLLLPMRTLAARPDAMLRRNRAALLGFRDADHGEGGPDALAWLDALLVREGVQGGDGEVWLHCLPRQYGFAFKPVSFWYVHRRDGALAAIVVEVNNTFGERHCYLLEPPGLHFGAELQARKVFHVSPFATVSGEYRFRFMRTDLDGAPADAGTPFGRTAVRIEWWEDGAPRIVTSVSGHVFALTPATRRRALVQLPLMTLAVVARIHWHALRLWLQRVRFQPKPARAPDLVSRGGALPAALAPALAPALSTEPTDPA